MSKWEPIEGAPRNGHAILACDDRIDDGFHQVIFWDDEGKDGYCWYVADSSIAYHEGFFTHWMPLPLPPHKEVIE